jgi:hypothetical protein
MRHGELCVVGEWFSWRVGFWSQPPVCGVTTGVVCQGPVTWGSLQLGLYVLTGSTTRDYQAYNSKQ